MTSEGLRVRIHRGAQQVGGSCVELESGGQRLLLDLGLPLDAEAGETPLPAVPGLDGDDASLLGIVLSHSHLDHVGLVPHISPAVPVAIGRTAARILGEARFFSAATPPIQPRWQLVDGEPLQVGPFRVTPRRVEHSAFDAFALHVEAGGRSLFYTGDFRGHGNDPAPFERLLARPPRPVHALLMEGTQLGDGREGDGPAEADLRRVLARRMREWPGLVLVAHSSQNVDRLRTVHEAAREAERRYVVDLYTATVADVAATVDAAVPVLSDEGLRLFARKTERLKVLAAREFHRVDDVRPWRVFAEDIRRNARGLVLQLRPSMVDELERRGLLEGALAIWSLWRGYLENPGERRMLQRFEVWGVPLEVHHVSGHAHTADLRRLVDALAPERVVPIHTEAPAAYARHFQRVEAHADGEWWHV